MFTSKDFFEMAVVILAIAFALFMMIGGLR